VPAAVDALVADHEPQLERAHARPSGSPSRGSSSPAVGRGLQVARIRRHHATRNCGRARSRWSSPSRHQPLVRVHHE
jgi:hypothetical protein